MRATPPQLDSSDLGSPKKVWQLLCEKDNQFQRDPNLFERHPRLKKDMRSMLIEWLMEVCSDRRLHRETFHLCIDYLDRYLEKSKKMEPSNLQLVASTALVIASKMEEIYPPKINEIAEYTDGCCTEENIRDMEEIMLQELNWTCTPITSVHWLALYLQLMNTSEIVPEFFSRPNAPKRHSRNPHSSANSSILSRKDDEVNKRDKSSKITTSPSRLLKERIRASEEENDENEGDANFENDETSASMFSTMNVGLLDSTNAISNVFDMSYVGYNSYSEGHLYPDQRCTVPKLMRDEFVRLAMILDLCMLDVDSLNFKYSELAAAVVSLCYEPDHLIHQVTGFSTNQLKKACDFLGPFVSYCEKLEPAGVQMPYFSDVHREDCHNIQIHVNKALDHLREIQSKRSRKRKLQDSEQ